MQKGLKFCLSTKKTKALTAKRRATAMVQIRLTCFQPTSSPLSLPYSKFSGALVICWPRCNARLVSNYSKHPGALVMLPSEEYLSPVAMWTSNSQMHRPN